MWLSKSSQQAGKESVGCFAELVQVNYAVSIVSRVPNAIGDRAVEVALAFIVGFGVVFMD